jgi:hypothetical protein
MAVESWRKTGGSETGASRHIQRGGRGLDGEEVAGNGETVGELGFSGSSWSFRRGGAVSMG